MKTGEEETGFRFKVKDLVLVGREFLPPEVCFPLKPTETNSERKWTCTLVTIRENKIKSKMGKNAYSTFERLDGSQRE